MGSLKRVIKTVRVRARREPRLWMFLVAEVVILPILTAVFAWIFEHDLLLFMVCTTALCVVFFTLLLIAIYRAPAAMEPEGVAKFVDDLLSDDRIELGGLGSVVKASLHLPEVLVSALDDKRPTMLPVINAVDVAYELLYARQLLPNLSFRLSAVHWVPPGRSESYWWKTDRAKAYFQLQRTLILNQRIEVCRLLISSTAFPLSPDDFNEWLAQASAQMKVRWAMAHVNIDTTEIQGDFMVLESLDTGGRIVSVDLVKDNSANDGVAHVQLMPSTTDEFRAQCTKHLDWFIHHWSQARALEIPNQSWWHDYRQHRLAWPQDDGRGILAFYNARQRIRKAVKFIKAVDISDTKDELGAVYDDSAYKGWYEDTIVSAKAIPSFVRVFVLKRARLSIDEFVKRHLGSYFDEHGQIWPGCRIHVVFQDDLDRGIATASPNVLKEWLDAHPGLMAHLRQVGEKDTDFRSIIRKVLLRDFLITESMIYDYRAKSVRFDFDHLPDYLIIPGDHSMHIIKEWEDAVALLIDIGVSKSALARRQFEDILQASLNGV